PEVVYLTSWFLGGAFAGLAGAILSMVITGTPAVGSLVIVPEFAGAIVGGIYSLFGSLAGGYLIGLSEYILITLLATYVSRNLVVYQPLIPLLVMSVFLLFYPEGIGGLQLSRVVERLRKSVWR
ncbi:MAG: branched-chain amino acid ABC transporter permease, partial [Candidatus Korarchaeum sp.]